MECAFQVRGLAGVETPQPWKDVAPTPEALFETTVWDQHVAAAADCNEDEFLDLEISGTDEATAESTAVVMCPVCAKNVPESKINAHLDSNCIWFVE